MVATDRVASVLNEIKKELIKAGSWKKNQPAWVTDFENNSIRNEQDFLTWLQFIYLPNCTKEALNTRKNIVPQALKFFEADMKQGRLLQLFVELDSLL